MTKAETAALAPEVFQRMPALIPEGRSLISLVFSCVGVCNGSHLARTAQNYTAKEGWECTTAKRGKHPPILPCHSCVSAKHQPRTCGTINHAHPLRVPHAVADRRACMHPWHVPHADVNRNGVQVQSH